MKAARLFKLETTALENRRLELQNHFECLELNEDAAPEDVWRELTETVAEASVNQ